MKKKMVSLLLCVVMLMGLLPMNALAVTTIGGEDTPLNENAKQCWTDMNGFSYYYFAFEEADNPGSRYAVLSSVQAPESSSVTTLTMPETLPLSGSDPTQIPLRVIDDLSGTWPETLTGVTLPSQLKTIGDKAFYQCGLTSVVIQNSVQTIGAQAFYRCALTSVEIPDSVKTIGTQAFYDQGHTVWVGWNTEWEDTLTSLTLGSGVQTIGEEAFAYNENLSNTSQNGTLILPDSLTGIGKRAFTACGFSSITWPNNPGFQEVKGFSYCFNLTGDVLASLPDSVNSIGCEAFAGCTGITQLTIPTFIQTIGEMAFQGCTALADLIIQNGVLTIGYGAFEGCTGLLGKSIVIPASVQTIFSGAFAGIYDAEAPGAKTLTVSLLNPDVEFPSGTTGESGYDYSYNYFEAEDTSHSNRLSSADPFAQCVTLVLRAPEGSAAQSYAAAKNGTVFKLGMNLNFCSRSVTFQEITESADPVYHIVTAQAADNVTFTVWQDGETLGSGAVVTVQALEGKDVVVTAHKKGYYDQVLKKTGAEFTADWTVELGAWEALPVSGKLLVSITRDDLPLGSFDGLTLSLKNGGSDVPFTASYPYLVLDEGHGLSADTSLTLTVTPDASMQITGGSAASTLGDGHFTMALKSWGKASITAAGTTYMPCIVILFDGEGNAVSSGITSGGVFTSDPLPAGVYTAVAYETNDYFGAVGSMDALSDLGLTAGDYAEGSVTITNGNTDKLTLTVPRLNAESLTSALDTGKCSVVFRSNQAVTGVTFNMQVNYGLKAGTAEKITFTLPAGASIQSVYGEQGALSVTGNSVTVNNASGTLYVLVQCTETGSKSFGASITTGGKTLPLGSGVVTVQDVFLNVSENYTAKRDGNRVEVYTKPNTAVSLAVSGVNTLITGTTNAVGRLTLTYNLPSNAAYGQKYTLAATADGGSGKTSITYFPASAELKQLGFHQTYDVTVIDNDDPSREDKFYTYIAFGKEKNKYFSLYATFEADQTLNTIVIVTMQDGSVSSVPLALIDEAGGIQTYAGELYLPGNSDDHVFHADSIPVGFEIVWEEPVAPKPDSDAIYAQAAARAAELQQARDNLWEDFLEEENLTQVEEGTMDIFFKYGYRITDTPAFQNSLLTKEKYGALKAGSSASEIAKLDELYAFDAQYLAGAYAAEAMMDEAANALTAALQLDKPIQQYNSWDEILSEMGMEYSEGNSYNPADLERDGYTRMGDFWYKDDRNGSFTAVWPDGFDTESASAAAALNLEETNSAARYAARETGGGFQISWDSTAKGIGGNSIEAGLTTAGHTLSAASKHLEAQAAATNAFADQKLATLIEDHPGDANLQKRRELRKMLLEKKDYATKQANWSKGLKWAGRVCGYANLVMDANQLNENIVATADSEAKASELDVLIQYYTTHIGPAGCLSAMQDEKRAYDLLNKLMNEKSTHLICNIGVGVVTSVADCFTIGAASKAALAYDVASGVVAVSRDAMIAEMQKTVEKLHAKRVADCGGEGWKKAPLRTLTPILDPSGIVYEAVESNVLSGVTAKIYEVSGVETLWNAGDYNQINPQITGVSGGYAWDVPPGTWQVKFTKAGYSTAQTEPLIVPPPRMNLKTAMESTAAPTVVSAAAYPDYVELVFSQYMSVTDELTVPEGYTYEWVSKEKVNAESSTEYSKVLHLKKSTAVGDAVTVTLSGAKNYAGTALAAYSSGPLTVAVEPAAIRLNYETQIAVLVGEEKDPRVTVQVLDDSGRPIPGLTVTAAIEDTAYATVTTVEGMTNSNGVATFSVKGLLPGWTEATFAVAGSSLTKTMPVRVTIASNQTEKPAASIGGNVYTVSNNSITVSRGTTLTLTCATEGAVIYYTTNDTCPCQAMDRQRYTGPITVNEDTYFRIAAYKDGMEYSERLNLRISVADAPNPIVPSYVITAIRSEHGTITSSARYAAAGSTVAVTAVPDEGYELESITATDGRGGTVKLTEQGSGRYTFTMPASRVSIQAVFTQEKVNPFTDLDSGEYYYDAVLWAVEKGITKGTSDTTFSPNAPCTRAQIVTFLWRAAGCPEPESGENPFTDVKPDTFYYQAMLWAVENEITNGTSDTTFSPNEICTRDQAMTFLWRAAGKPAAGTENPFVDVKGGTWYTNAVQWAVENEITIGTSDTTFSPGENCTRGQIVTFLYRCMKDADNR